MGRLVVMMPNTLGRAFDAIDALADEGHARPGDCAVLKALYATGWQDGFVAGSTRTIASSFGISETRLLAAIAALGKIHTIGVRTLPAGGLAIELLSLAQPWIAGDVGLGWWQYYLVDDGGEQPAEDDAA